MPAVSHAPGLSSAAAVKFDNPPKPAANLENAGDCGCTWCPGGDCPLISPCWATADTDSAATATAIRTALCLIVCYWLRSKRRQYLDVSGAVARYAQQTVTTKTPAPRRQVTQPAPACLAAMQ